MPPTITMSRNTTRMASQSGSTLTAASVTYIDTSRALSATGSSSAPTELPAAAAPRQPAVHRVGQPGRDEHEECRAEPMFHHQPYRQRHDAQPREGDDVGQRQQHRRRASADLRSVRHPPAFPRLHALRCAERQRSWLFPPSSGSADLASSVSRAGMTSGDHDPKPIIGNSLTYRAAGVDMEAADALVETIKPLARATNRRGRDGRPRRLRRAVRPEGRGICRSGAGLRHRRRRDQAQGGDRDRHPRHGRCRSGGDVRQRHRGAGRRTVVLPRLLRDRQAGPAPGEGSDRRHRLGLQRGRLRPGRRRDGGDARAVPRG